MVDKNGNSRMVDSENSSDAVRHAKALNSKLLLLPFLFLAIQFTINWSANSFFSSHVEISRSIHSFFARWDEITPALQRLKVFYRVPVDGREFSQVFAIYFFLLAPLCLYAFGLFALLLSKRYRQFWHQMRARDYLALLVTFPFGFGGIFEFLVAPWSLKNYHGLYGRDFLGSYCSLLAIAQFVIFSILALVYVLGGKSAQKS